MHEEAAQRRAALASCAHRGESNAAKCQVEIGSGSDNRCLVAPELQKRAREALRKPRANCAAHSCRTCSGNQSDLRVINEKLADIAIAKQYR